MYPVIRMVKELIVHRNAAPLALGETHVSHHRCWPWDIDLWMELNNGRTLTLYDLGRVVVFNRMGISAIMKRRRWVGTVAGSSVRYRARVRMFDRIEMRSTVIGWDDRFTYAVQSMWRGKTCTSQALLRMAVANESGIVPTRTLAEAMRLDPTSPPLPDWVQAWIAAENIRPWPPQLQAAHPAFYLARPAEARSSDAQSGGERTWSRHESASGDGSFSTGRANPTTPLS